MGAYNILTIKVECNNCNKPFDGQLQFKFGDTWQNSYQLGDRIKWDRNNIGIPNLPKVKAYSILESAICPYCGFNNKEEYDIYIKNDIIEKVDLLSSLKDYSFDNDGDYIVYE